MKSAGMLSCLAKCHAWRSWGIGALGLAYLVCQLWLIVRAYEVPNRRFGFWMFAESSRWEAFLERELKNGARVPVPQGVWQVTSGKETTVVYAWGQMVRDFNLNHLERPTHAKNNLATTLAALQAALDYVARHTPADQETARLYLRVRFRRAQSDWQEVLFQSPPRLVEKRPSSDTL